MRRPIFRLNDPSVSRRHAQLSIVGQKVFVEDSRLRQRRGHRRRASRRARGAAPRFHDATRDLRVHLAGRGRARERAGLSPRQERRKTRQAEYSAQRRGPQNGRHHPADGADPALGGGSLQGTRFSTRPPHNQGRPWRRGNELALNDDSVSRNHAELVRSGPGYLLRDLASVNGTSVNGVRILTRLLTSGDRVRFGTVEFIYLGPSAAQTRQVEPRHLRRLALWAVGIFAFLLLLMVLRLHERHQGGPVTVDKDDDAAQADRYIAKALDDRRDELWEKAREFLPAGVALDPLNLEARKGIKQVEAELKMKELFERAKQRVDLGQDEEGVEYYLQIGSDSSYYPRARAEVHSLTVLLKRRYDERCHTAEHAMDFEGIVQGCGHYLNLVCNGQIDKEKLGWVRTAEGKLGARLRGGPWSCPQSYAHWFNDESVGENVSLEQQIHGKYRNPKLAEAVKLYAQGQARTAFNRLQALKDTPAESRESRAAQALVTLDRAYGQYSEGVASLQAGDLRGARKHWTDSSASTNRLCPATRRAAWPATRAVSSPSSTTGWGSSSFRRPVTKTPIRPSRQATRFSPATTNWARPSTCSSGKRSRFSRMARAVRTPAMRCASRGRTA